MVPFGWKVDNQNYTIINAKTGANIECGPPGLQLYVNTAGVKSNCGPKLGVGHCQDSLPKFILSTVKYAITNTTFSFQITLSYYLTCQGFEGARSVLCG